MTLIKVSEIVSETSKWYSIIASRILWFANIMFAYEIGAMPYHLYALIPRHLRNFLQQQKRWVFTSILFDLQFKNRINENWTFWKEESNLKTISLGVQVLHAL